MRFADKLRTAFFERTREAIEDLYASDALIDVNVPAWRFQRKGHDEILEQYLSWSEGPMTIFSAKEHETPWGAVVVHDCNPTARDAQTAAPSRALWLGTVWKAWAKLRSARPDLSMAVVDVDLGCGVIMRGRQECYPLAFESYDELDYAVLEGDRRRLLNLISAREFMTQYSGQRR